MALAVRGDLSQRLCDEDTPTPIGLVQLATIAVRCPELMNLTTSRYHGLQNDVTRLVQHDRRTYLVPEAMWDILHRAGTVADVDQNDDEVVVTVAPFDSAHYVNRLGQMYRNQNT